MALERMIIQAMALWKVMFLSRRRLMVRGGHCIDEGGGGEGVRGDGGGGGGRLREKRRRDITLIRTVGVLYRTL